MVLRNYFGGHDELEGVWAGWGHMATAVMKNGEYPGAAPNHYAVGTYKDGGDTLEMSVTVTQCGKLRTVFEKNPLVI